MSKHSKQRIASALLFLGAIAAWATEAMAIPAQPIMASHDAGVHLKDVAGYVMGGAGLFTVVGGGWLAYAQLQFRKISGIGRGLDQERKDSEQAWRDHLEKYNDDKLAMVKEYATKADLERIDQHMDKMREEFKEGLNKIDHRIEGLGNRLDSKED